MTKYECCCAANTPCRCVIECSTGIAPLRCCLTGDSSCNWRRVENQEVETPVPNVSEWCKIGAWVYVTPDNREPYYGKVYAVDCSGVMIAVENAIATRTFFINRIRPARLRPWNDDELKSKVGKVFEMENGDLTLCLGFSQDRGTLFFAGKGPCPYSAEYLAETNWKLDGSPCGVLEHYEQGEWVK